MEASGQAPSVPKAELRSQLETAGFECGEAAPNGDCYRLLSAAGFEISATQAARPDAAATEHVRSVRAGAVGLLASTEPIDGIDATVFRQGEYLPSDAAAAAAALAPPVLLTSSALESVPRPRRFRRTHACSLTYEYRT